MNIKIGDYLLGDDYELVKVTQVDIDVDRVDFKILDDPNNAYANDSDDQLDYYVYSEIVRREWINYGRAYDTPLWKVLNAD